MKPPETLAGYVFMIPYRQDLDSRLSDAVEAALLAVEGVQSVADAMGARPFYLVEVLVDATEQLDDLATVEKKLLAAAQSITPDMYFCQQCQRWTPHKEYPLDYQCTVCESWLWSEGPLTQAEWDALHNPKAAP